MMLKIKIKKEINKKRKEEKKKKKEDSRKIKLTTSNKSFVIAFLISFTDILKIIFNL